MQSQMSYTNGVLGRQSSEFPTMLQIPAAPTQSMTGVLNSLARASASSSIPSNREESKDAIVPQRVVPTVANSATDQHVQINIDLTNVRQSPS